ncbi:TPM domain-containing protein [Seminibacterium arietis]|uniref:TPM domain-containing protein n=1 Tax=Seminibacterium arietis TaxID=1173502 RepID=A0ABW3I7F1_9PAST
MSYWQRSAVVFLLFLIAFPSFAVDFPPPPQPFRYVNDYTQTLTAAEQQFIEQHLRQFSKETSSQIAVVILPTTGEYEIADYAFALGDKWGIGRKQLDNGVLMLVAIKDRNIFIATGQGLEGALPDVFLARLIRNQILPHFKQGQYAQGIAIGLDNIIAAAKGEFAPLEQQESAVEKYIPLIFMVIFILFIFLGRGKGVYISPSHHSGGLHSRRRGNSSGFGGGFGGFGGGSNDGGFGGGGFGGGGAGGSW